MVSEMKFAKFVPLTKMEEQADGTLHVYGTVTAEQPDLSNEVCDYAGTKPYYQAKVEKMFKLTSAVEGVTPSLMPMREMHQLKSIGAGRTIEFDDANKTIRMGFEVVDPVAIIKFKKGVLIGFSQGGDYVGGLTDDPVFKGCKRYIADPSEVSGVDAPCLPSAMVDAMKGRTVTLAKAAGGEEQIALVVPERSEGVDFIIDFIKKFAIAGIAPILPETPVGSSTAATGGKEKAVKITDQAGLTKAAKTIGDHLDKLHEMHKAHGEQMEKAHEAIQDRHEKLGEHIEKCMKCAKDASEGEEPEAAEKTAPTTDLAKFAALETQIAAMAKAHTDSLKELTDKLAKTAQPIAAHTGAVDPLAKTAPGVPAGFEDLIQAPAVTR